MKDKSDKGLATTAKRINKHTKKIVEKNTLKISDEMKKEDDEKITKGYPHMQMNQLYNLKEMLD